jgi:uncharacterized membrane protein YcgQ (UPF0703/DUF1980 family)
MKAIARYIAVSASILLLSLSLVSLAADLFHREVTIRAKEGNDLIVVLDEIERFDKFSIIRVKFISGASVPSATLLVRSFYEMAKQRKADYFINLKEWDDEKGNRAYKIGFALQ